MKYGHDISPGSMLYVPIFIKIGSGIHKLMRGIYRYIDIKGLTLTYFTKVG
jgi:hypothetical protein